MIVLDWKISNVTRDRDFGMVEANVTMLAKTQAGQPARPITMRTHVPAKGGNLRARLLDDARTLAVHLAQLPKTSAVNQVA